MGKHERGEIEKAEKIIVKILNNEEINEEDKKNYWFEHIFILANKIKEDFSNIKKAYHLGNNYDSLGDIFIETPEKKYFVEIKMSYTKKGIGTQANISQNALTLNGLFEKDTLHWSDFRDKFNHNYWVSKILNMFRDYPKKIILIKNKIQQLEEKARYLRDIKKRNVKAAKILSLIHEKDRKEKIEYLKYLSTRKQNNDNIKKFTIAILLGIHKQSLLKDFFNKNFDFKLIEHFFVYYSNFFNKKIIVKQDDLGKKIKMINRLSNFKIIFPKNVTYCQVVGLSKNREIPLLEIVFHWKNIAQGIKTPCLNIFKLI